MIVKAAKRIFNSDKICCSYDDFYFGVTFFGTHCIYNTYHIACLRRYTLVSLMNISFHKCQMMSINEMWCAGIMLGSGLSFVLVQF